MIGTHLKQIRKQKGLSQKSLADLLSTSSGYISEIEQGKTVPGGNFFLSLKRALGVSIDWLLTGQGNPYINDQITEQKAGACPSQTADAEGLFGKTKRESAAGAEFTVTEYGSNNEPGEKTRSPEPEVAELMEMTREIVTSDTEYAPSLAANIRSFHRAMWLERKVQNHEKRLAQLEQDRIKADGKDGLEGEEESKKCEGT